MADKIIATDAQGALSEGDHGNDAFPSPARVGDTAYTDIAPPAGKEHANFTLLAKDDAHPSGNSPAVGLCLTENGIYSVGALAIGAFTEELRVWSKALGPCTNPGLVSEYEGFTLVAGNTVSGDVESEGTATGAATDVEGAAGTTGSDSGLVGDATVHQVIPTAEGTAGSDSGAAGAAQDVEAAGGGASSTGAATGGAAEAEKVSGSVASDGAATGAATYVPGATAPAQVTGLTLTPGETSIAATWSVPSGSPTSYHVQYKAHSSGTWLDWDNGTPDDPTTNAVTITGLTLGVEYDVQVRAHNAVGDGDYSTTTTTTTPHLLLSIDLGNTYYREADIRSNIATLVSGAGHPTTAVGGSPVAVNLHKLWIKVTKVRMSDHVVLATLLDWHEVYSATSVTDPSNLWDGLDFTSAGAAYHALVEHTESLSASVAAGERIVVQLVNTCGTSATPAAGDGIKWRLPEGQGITSALSLHVYFGSALVDWYATEEDEDPSGTSYVNGFAWGGGASTSDILAMAWISVS